MKELVRFLKNIQKNNNREWFEAHKDEYKKLHGEFATYMQMIGEQIATFDPAVKRALKNPKTVKVFRIYRDARFSRNKEPYKTNFGGVILLGEAHQSAPCYYVHIEPGNSFVGGGIHMPERLVLNAIRDNIAENEKPLRKVLAQASFKKHLGTLSQGSMLKTVPRGFDIEHPAADLLRYKSFTAGANFKDTDVTAAGFDKQILKVFKALKPLNDYLGKAV